MTVQKIFYNEDEGFHLTLELMSTGERFIKNMPLICLPIGLQGRPDLLVRTDDIRSELGHFSYYVVEIKIARNIQKAHILQGAVYNRLLGLVQGYEPTEFYVMNRDRDTQTIQMSDVAVELDTIVRDMRDVLSGNLVEPCHGAGRWPWENYVNSLAMEANDVSLIPGVGVAKRQDFLGAGFKTVDAIADAEAQELTKLKGVGITTARKFITAASAIHQSQPVQRQKDFQVPQTNTGVFIDLEGTDPRIGVDGLEVVNYLIGALVRDSSQPPTFKPFFASAVEEEESILREFFDWAASLGDAVFYHWHHYERTNLLKMAEYYGLEQSQVAQVMDRFVDLYPITTKPESTEGRPWGQPLKKPAGAPLNLG